MYKPGTSPLRYLQVQQESSALVGCVFGSLNLCVFQDVRCKDARTCITSIRTALVGATHGLVFSSYVIVLVCIAEVPHTAHRYILFMWGVLRG